MIFILLYENFILQYCALAILVLWFNYDLFRFLALINVKCFGLVWQLCLSIVVQINVKIVV